MRVAWCADTSVVVAAVSGWHDRHDAAVTLVNDRAPTLPADAWFESYSVLTRLPSDRRLAGVDAATVLEASFPEPLLSLPVDDARELVRRLGGLSITGGATYDALVAAAGRAAGATLLTFDRRASRTYDLLGCPYELH